MRLLIMNHIENARESLRSNKLRTRLTVLGIDNDYGYGIWSESIN